MTVAKNTVHWVCGGGKGLGLEIANQLIKSGERVVISTRNRTEGLAGSSATLLLGDLSDPQVVQSHIAAIESDGFAVNQVYCATHKPMNLGRLSELSWGSFSQQFEGSVKPLFNILKYFVGRNQLRPSLVLAFSSGTVGQSDVTYSHRNTAKMGLEGFVQSLAKDPDLESVRLLCLRLGYVRTEQFEVFLHQMRIDREDFERNHNVSDPVEAASEILGVADTSEMYESGSIINCC